MKKLCVLAIAVAMLFALSVSLLAQEEQKPQPQDKPQPGEEEQGKEEGQDEEPAEEELTPLEKHMRDLYSDSAQTREYAIRELVKLGEQAVPELSKIFGVGLFDKKEELSDELKARIEKLIQDLDSEEWTERENATKELEKIGEAAETYLRRVAEFGTLEVKSRAEKLLAKIEEKRRGGKDEQELERSRFFAKLGAVRALGEIGAKSCNAGLVAALEDGEKLVSTLALMQLREASGWSFGYGPDDLEKRKKKVSAKWAEYLEKPAAPAGEEAVELKGASEAGDVLKMRSAWNFESVYTNRSMSTRVTMQGGQRKTQQIINTYSVVSETIHQQEFADTVQEMKPGLVKFVREYKQHRTGTQSYTEQSGGRIFPRSTLQMTPTQFSGSELELTGRTGTTDIDVLKGNLSLSQKEWVLNNLARLDALIPGKSVKPGDSWDVPELAALRLLRSLGPDWAQVLDVSSVRLKCRLLEVTDKDGKKLARISVTAEFGIAEANLPAAAAAGNIVRISTYGVGGMKSLAGCSLIGDCTFDLASGAVNSFKLFGALLPTGEPRGQFGNTNREQTTYGYFKLEVTGSREKAGK